MSRWRSVWLVARREILERGRSRGFLLSVLFTTVIVVGAFVLPAVLFGNGSATKVGDRRAGPGRPRAAAIESAAGRFDQKVRISTFPTGTRPMSALTDGPVDVVVDDAGRPVRSGRAPVLEEDRPERRCNSCRPRPSGSGSRPSSGRATSTSRRWPPPSSRRRSVALEPQTETDQAKFLVANIGAVLSSSASSRFGFTVLTGVVEEKQSRVVEVVLSTVRPRDLLMGKVLGIGVLGLVQLASCSWSRR